MVRSYRNGEVPSEWLIQFASGYNSVDGAWVHSLPPSTYRKHLALVAIAKRNTGRDLKIGVGHCAYRSLPAQVMLKKRFGIMAATPGTSSHGGLWEGQQVMAIDYSNWSSVYGGDRAAWFRDVRAAGFAPDMISPRRGYPDEPWHVIDYEPWVAVPSGGGSSSESEEDDMFDEKDRALLKEVLTETRNTKAGVWTGGVSNGQTFKYGALPIVAHNQTLIARLTAQVGALSAAVQALAAAKGADPKAVLAAVEVGVKNAMKDVTFSVDVDG